MFYKNTVWFLVFFWMSVDEEYFTLYLQEWGFQWPANVTAVFTLVPHPLLYHEMRTEKPEGE